VNRPRVLVVEDDAAIRRFIELALEDEPIDLVTTGSLAAALQALEQPPYALVLTDLMLPDGSGLDLLQALADRPAWRGGARLAVFSAGVSAATRERLAGLGVERVITKPAPLAALLDCVRWATAPGDGSPGAAPPAQQPLLQADPVAEYFAGDHSLYQAFRASCVAQFPADVASGDDAAARDDLPALRRLTHSLKTVLRSLGQGTDSALAAQVEDAAAAGQSAAARQGWAQLRTRLPTA
jgi:CheY-like chemotaxis protein